MVVLYRQEWKSNLKGFLIWFCVIVGMCFGCILMYSSVESSLSDMGDIFAKMGMMSKAFGMDRLSVATMGGYFATEIAMLHALGGGMFAAILGSNLLSKEEFGHTIEYLAVLPLSRISMLVQKYFAMVSMLLCFQVVGMLCYLGGFAIMEETLSSEHLLLMGSTQFLMMLEIGSICFAVSACSRKNRMGVGLGVAMIFFAMDILCRVIPAIEDLKYVTPFYFCNATDIFTDVKPSAVSIVIAICVILGSVILSVSYYQKKDLQ
ncbi:MAG: ABC transporter permease subunit [Lachnospiraceae bacterium]|nr:ABC transporter permease subunit [Lachnospiraceae bacterium]